MKETYKSYLKEISAFIPRERIYTDEMRRLAWGTDASFYRLVPQIVVRSKTEEEVSRLLSAARQAKIGKIIKFPPMRKPSRCNRASSVSA